MRKIQKTSRITNYKSHLAVDTTDTFDAAKPNKPTKFILRATSPAVSARPAPCLACLARLARLARGLKKKTDKVGLFCITVQKVAAWNISPKKRRTSHNETLPL